ncbi:MAG: hypothetical protein KDH08_22840, partial [Anaerolineae bacterium]|nr:hypothetical protein [Anaerolineae bacterium]
YLIELSPCFYPWFSAVLPLVAKDAQSDAGLPVEVGACLTDSFMLTHVANTVRIRHLALKGGFPHGF